MSTDTDAATWSVSAGHRPQFWLPTTSAFNDNLLSWAYILTRPERRLLIHWVTSLGGETYMRWYDWVVVRDPYEMYHTLRDLLPENEPRRVPDHVETQAMRRQWAMLEQEPELIYRLRMRMEADLLQEAQEDARLTEWWDRRQEERRERESRSRES